MIHKTSKIRLHIIYRNSVVKHIATTVNSFTIELIKILGKKDIPDVIKVSKSLVDSFGVNAVINMKNINNYFAYPDTFPFVGRYHGRITAYIIGTPLEKFQNEGCFDFDVNMGEMNTLYTYAYAILPEFRGKGFAKELKYHYLLWAKNKGYKYVSGSVREGVTKNLHGKIEVLKKHVDWNRTGLTFEYYRRTL
ncbi:MAG: GNAT family N-acetyltransferase [Fidelibacterota bacterium]